MLCRFVSDRVASYETLETTSLHFNARAHWIFIYAGTRSPSKASERYFAMKPNEFNEFGEYWKYRNQEAWKAYRHVDIARQQRRLRVEHQKKFIFSISYESNRIRNDRTQNSLRSLREDHAERTSMSQRFPFVP